MRVVGSVALGGHFRGSNIYPSTCTWGLPLSVVGQRRPPSKVLTIWWGWSSGNLTRVDNSLCKPGTSYFWSGEYQSKFLEHANTSILRRFSRIMCDSARHTWGVEYLQARRKPLEVCEYCQHFPPVTEDKPLETSNFSLTLLVYTETRLCDWIERPVLSMTDTIFKYIFRALPPLCYFLSHRVGLVMLRFVHVHHGMFYWILFRWYFGDSVKQTDKINVPIDGSKNIESVREQCRQIFFKNTMSLQLGRRRRTSPAWSPSSSNPLGSFFKERNIRETSRSPSRVWLHNSGRRHV